LKLNLLTIEVANKTIARGVVRVGRLGARGIRIFLFGADGSRTNTLCHLVCVTVHSERDRARGMIMKCE
jgi:hypothetical protein